jgi:probable HAF family extracellular repeat protein
MPVSCLKPTVHVVGVRDTLWGIARHHDVTVEALLAANPQITDRSLLRVGDEVTISPIDLGPLRGRNSSASDINDRGQVVGTSGPPGALADDFVDEGEVHGFFWQGGVMTDLGTLGGWWSRASASNEQGQVVGLSRVEEDLDFRVYLWEEGVIRDLGLPSGIDSDPAVNDRGQVVAGNLLWQDGVTRDLGSLGGGRTAASDINNRGQVVGWSATTSGGWHAFLWQDGVMRDLGTLGGADSEATAINDRGQVVGWSYTTADRSTLAFFWEDGVMTQLGDIEGSWATDINEHGQIVGSSDTPSGLRRAFLWQDGAMIDLGSLVSAADTEYGDRSLVANAINNCGQVVGEDSRLGYPLGRAMLWTAPTS